MSTIFGKTEKLRNGYKMDFFTNYVFGGLIQEDDGRFVPTNDLVEVVAKNVLLDRSQTDVENPIKPSFTITNADEVTISLVQERGGIKPLPRRDHQALLITNNQYLLIYGGKNDNSFSYTNSDPVSPSHTEAAIYNDVTNSSLDDIMLFKFETLEWTAVA